LWIKAEVAPEVNCKPLKNNKNGIEPPTNPIIINFNQSFAFKFISDLNSFKNIIIANRNMAATIFLEKVKISGLIPETPN
jgi:hypothetical protein